MNILKYDNIIFDCDGVILNSNDIKTNVFRKISLPFGQYVSNDFVKYHIENQGASRYLKIKHLTSIVDEKDELKNSLEERLIKLFSDEVRDSLLSAEITSDLSELRSRTIGQNWFVVSGGDQDELRYVFSKKGISDYFNKGIYGSPRTKYELIDYLKEINLLKGSTVFIGDSKLDYKVAKNFNFDFIFLYQWTDFEDWRRYFKKIPISVFKSISELCSKTHSI
jgi:phosphoglycolate phosphatase-like HAD superfamily hydrolase